MNLDRRLATGRLRAVLATGAWAPVVESLALETEFPELETRELLGRRVVVKRSRLRGKSAIRHGIRGLCGVPVPRIREFHNLAWLRARLFEAPRPLFAGVLRSAGLPEQQFLATELLEGAQDLRSVLTGKVQVAYSHVLGCLARETARMHALGFVHRDLYPRNILMTGSGIAFLDAWRGGTGLDLRGPTSDLACLMLHGSSWLTGEEQRQFFCGYFAAREQQGRPVHDRARFAHSIERHRTRMIERLRKRPQERRGLEVPSADWRVPAAD